MIQISETTTIWFGPSAILRDRFISPGTALVLSYTMSDTGAGSSIGYFEHINSPAQAYYYYWLTPWQYMQWRRECHGKTMKEAKQEFMWLRDQHQLISHSEGNETYFFIDVQTVDIFQRQADKHNWGINISSSSSSSNM